jgi:hypothetical protein
MRQNRLQRGRRPQANFRSERVGRRLCLLVSSESVRSATESAAFSIGAIDRNLRNVLFSVYYFDGLSGPLEQGS